jgi:hypothetical protein
MAASMGHTRSGGWRSHTRHPVGGAPGRAHIHEVRAERRLHGLRAMRKQEKDARGQTARHAMHERPRRSNTGLRQGRQMPGLLTLQRSGSVSTGPPTGQLTGALPHMHDGRRALHQSMMRKVGNEGAGEEIMHRCRHSR